MRHSYWFRTNVVLLTLGLSVTTVVAVPLGTAFTHKGEYKPGGTPVTGVYDFQIVLFDVATGGTPINTIICEDTRGIAIGTVICANVMVTQGQFTVGIGYGAPPFATTTQYWLETRVRVGNAFTVVGGRQKLNAVPYALNVRTLPPGIVTGANIALNAVGPAAILDNSIAATDIGINAVGLTEINPTQVQTRVSGICPPGTSMRAIGQTGSMVTCDAGGSNAWRLLGNAGTNPATHFLGTTDIRALAFRTGGLERMRLRENGFVGIGLNAPGEKLHIGDGNILLEGGGETALMFKRDLTITGESGTSTNPIFKFGRIQQAGDGDPEVRVLYSDNVATERTVFEFDRKGIVASVKPDFGSHFEGFIGGQKEPLFRLNSSPTMQLEMGAGGDQLTDVKIRREAAGTMVVETGNVARMRVGPTGVQVLRKYLQLPAALGVPPASDCNSDTHAGRVTVRIDGPVNLYICRGAAGWVGK